MIVFFGVFSYGRECFWTMPLFQWWSLSLIILVFSPNNWQHVSYVSVMVQWWYDPQALQQDGIATGSSCPPKRGMILKKSSPKFDAYISHDGSVCMVYMLTKLRYIDGKWQTIYGIHTDPMRYEGVPLNGWSLLGKIPSFDMDDDLGVALFQETTIWLSWYVRHLKNFVLLIMMIVISAFRSYCLYDVSRAWSLWALESW